MTRIILDVDEVLASWTQRAKYLLERYMGCSLPMPTSYISADNCGTWGISVEAWTWLTGRCWQRGLLWEHLQPFPGAAQASRALGAHGRVLVATQRPTGTFEQTVSWLTRQGIYYNGFYHMGALRKSGLRGDLYIDDSPMVAMDVLEHTRADVALVCRTHNAASGAILAEQHGDRVTLCRSWEEIYEQAARTNKRVGAGAHHSM